MPVSPRIRPATPDDVAALVDIEQQSFKGDRLSLRALQRQVRSPTSDALVAVVDGRPAAYVLTLYRRGSASARIYSIAVHPSARGLGLSRRLMAAAEQAALRRRCDRMRLEVRVDNAPAIHLYEAMDYRLTGCVPNYYEDGAAALRFEKRLKAS
jgi:[ribosomal protein S18]-alanine N-acetyltransferase